MAACRTMGHGRVLLGFKTEEFEIQIFVNCILEMALMLYLFPTILVIVMPCRRWKCSSVWHSDRTIQVYKPNHPRRFAIEINWNAAIAQSPFDSCSFYFGSCSYTIQEIVAETGKSFHRSDNQRYHQAAAKKRQVDWLMMLQGRKPHHNFGNCTFSLDSKCDLGRYRRWQRSTWH